MANEEYAAQARAAGWTDNPDFRSNESEPARNSTGDWLGNARVYEWSGEYGDIGPEIPKLERELFGGEYQMRKGDHLGNLDKDVFVEGPQKLQPARAFSDMGIHPVILRNIELARFERPTAVQSYAIPAALRGSDVVACAHTGSGKSAAYLIPAVSKLCGQARKLSAPKPAVHENFQLRLHGVRAEPLVVVVVPTRELGIQIFEEACRMCYRTMLRPVVAYGGRPMVDQLTDLGQGCDVLISTPGRLCDLMDRPNVLTMKRVKFTIVDEADELLSADWEEELGKILMSGDTNEDPDHQYMMFSATFPKAMREMARQFLADEYVRIRVGRAGSAHKNIRQDVVFVDQDKKEDAVWDLIMHSKPERTLIFCNYKREVDQLDSFLWNRGLQTTSIHSDRGQREREDALRNFRTGTCPILIATGVSARGWDIKDLKHVINYDLPSGQYGGITEYIHRIGRTARIGHQGLATSFYNDRNEDLAQDLVNVLVECEGPVPDFLQQYTPEGGKLIFDDDTDDEGEAENTAGEDAQGFAPVENGEAAGAAPTWGAAPVENGHAAAADAWTSTATEDVAASAW